MRPISIAFEGFGPFVGPQVIRFDELDNVFVVSGETGAGKTTIFDAMSYALYGKPLGDRPHQSVRSTLAGPLQATSVRFRFSCQGRVYEIYRSPYHRPRPGRGGGITYDERVVTFADVGPDGAVTVRANLKPAAVDALVTEPGVVGLKHEEFSTVIVLPQGKFQKFLELSSQQRAQLVRSLFPTEDATALTEAAKAAAGERVEAVKQIVAAQKHLETLFNLARFADDHAELLARAQVAADEEQARLLEARAAQEALVVGRGLAESIRQAMVAEARRQELAAEEPAIEALRVEIARAGGAARAEVALRALRELESRVAVQRAGVGAREASVVGAESALEALRPGAERLPAREDALGAQEAELGAVRLRLEGVGELVKARAEVARLEVAAALAGRHAEAARAVLVGAEQALEALAGVQAERDALDPQLNAARAEVARLEAGEPSAVEVLAWTATGEAEMRLKERQAQGACEAAQGVVAEADGALARARAVLEADAVAVLAAALVEGEACPVCGSADHPAPAAGSATSANARALVAAAEASLQSARGALEARVAAVAQVATERQLREDRVAGARARLAELGFAEPQAWQQATTSAKALLAGHAATAERLGAQLAGRGALVQRQVQAREAASLAAEAASRAAGVLEQARGVEKGANERLGGVDDPVATQRALESRRVALSTAIGEEREAMSKLREAVVAAEQALAVARSARDQAREVLVASESALPAAVEAVADALLAEGFAAPAEVSAALRSPAAEQALRQRVAAHEREVAAVVARLEQLLAQVAGRGEPNLDELQRLATVATEAATQASAALGRARAEVEALLDKKRQHDELAARKAAIEAEAEGLLDLARSLTGDNPRRITFPTFVLTAWFNRVVAHGSRRFNRLSQGQYDFVLRPDTVDKRSEGGLDLSVFDFHSAVVRDVSTLSGGEKFLASLSLALGLADVIAEKSGGIQIDTLFIDEGFGSLDANALDRALDVVGDIAATRRVGLISHVDAVKKAIPCHVEVLKSPTGSSIGGAAAAP